MVAAGVAAALALAPAGAQEAPDTGVAVDPEAYIGVWYEIARTPAPFQQDCVGGVTALYEIAAPDTIRVLNRCDLPGGEVDSIEGTAEALNENFNALAVDLPGPPPEPGANYLIEAVGPLEDGQYRWAAVRSPDDGIGWILARSPELDGAARTEAEDALAAAGIDTGALRETEQPPQNYDAGG